MKVYSIPVLLVTSAVLTFGYSKVQKTEGLSGVQVAEATPPRPAESKSAKAPGTRGPVERLLSVCGVEPAYTPDAPGSPGKWIPSSINPNGHSELAYTMREMVKDMEDTRKQILVGETPDWLPDLSHGKIRCAWPTAESMKGAAFEVMAVNYLHAVAAEQTKPLTAAAYNRVVKACIQCHQNTCDGPTEAISRLYIKTNPDNGKE